MKIEGTQGDINMSDGRTLKKWIDVEKEKGETLREEKKDLDPMTLCLSSSIHKSTFAFMNLWVCKIIEVGARF